MKSYDELKAEMEAIQQQMVEAKKNERANALKEVKRLCKEFGFTAGMLKGAFDLRLDWFKTLHDKHVASADKNSLGMSSLLS